MKPKFLNQISSVDSFVDIHHNRNHHTALKLLLIVLSAFEASHQVGVFNVDGDPYSYKRSDDDFIVWDQEVKYFRNLRDHFHIDDELLERYYIRL